MLSKFFQKQWLWLDEKQWPQKLVAWLLKRRTKSNLEKYFKLPSSSGTYAVCISIASPLISTKDLYFAVVPLDFGVWRDYKVIETLMTKEQVVLVLQELRTGTEFTLIAPAHSGLSKRSFNSIKIIRLTCESSRSRLITLRHSNGQLLAAGTLELIPQAAFSKELTQ